MKINKVYQCGLESIHAGLMSGKDRVSMFGSNASSILNHILISFELDQVNGAELIYLKKMTKDIKILKVSRTNPFDRESIEYGILEKLISLENDITSDIDISNIENSKNIIPIGALTYTVIATFNGTSITSVTGTMFQNLFTINTAGNNVFMKEFPPEKQLNEILAKMFFNNFYSYMADSVDNIDIVTDFILHKKYYNYIDDTDKVILTHVNSPMGSMEFLDNTEDGLYSQLVNIKKYNRLKTLNKKPDMNVFFTVETTFRTFLKIFTTSDCIVDMQDIKILLSESHINLSEDILDKYSNRILDYTTELFNHRETLLTDTNKKFQRFMLIMLGQPIKYSIKLDINAHRVIDDTDNEIVQLNDEILGLMNTIRNLILN